MISGNNENIKRKALLKASAVLSCAVQHQLSEEDAKECLELVNAALNEPIRNYEIGTVNEQYSRYCRDVERYTGKSILELQGHCHYESTAKCFAHWSQMPFEKGENDE